MKKLLFAVMCGMMLGSLFAQEENQASAGREFKNESKIYYQNVPIEKIYAHRSGYVVRYSVRPYKTGTLYIPVKWFDEEPSKAERVTLGPGQTWPSITLYYKDGAFISCRLYVRAEASHPSWGTLPLTANIDDRFEGVEELKLVY